MSQRTRERLKSLITIVIGLFVFIAILVLAGMAECIPQEVVC